MTNQVIPEAAVEAAALALLTKEVGGAFDDRLYAEDLEACREDARAALEAAAPHMLAEAKADALDEAARMADKGEGGGHDSGECADWSEWLRTLAAAHKPTP